MGWLRLVGSLKLSVSFAKEPYKKDNILQKRPTILRSLLIEATPYQTLPLRLQLTLSSMPDSAPMATHTHAYMRALSLSLSLFLSLSLSLSLSPSRSLSHTHTQLHKRTRTCTHAHTHLAPREGLISSTGVSIRDASNAHRRPHHCDTRACGCLYVVYVYASQNAYRHMYAIID